MLIARWKPGFEAFHKGVDAQTVAEEVQQIIDLNGSATPAEIVKLARNDSTELHKCFTWADTEAAEKWRLQEARTLIHHLVIQVKREDKEDTPQTIRVFHKVDTSWDSGYKPIEHIVHNLSEYDALLQQAKRDFISLRKKYEMLDEFNDLFSLIDSLTI